VVLRASRILIVEDDVDLRRMFRQALTLGGYDVIEAGDGMEALRVLDGQLPDAIVLDLGLPIVDGYVVRQEIAAQAHLRQIPVVVVTGLPVEHDALDVFCVLQKPVSTERLIQTLRSCMAAGSSSRAPSG
jgi:CheY-like chemotaxis protein